MPTNSDSPCAQPTNTRDQYQHFVPRFILRRFQVGVVKSKAERKKEFRRTGVDPEHVHYYDVATGILDIRPIGKVYGIPNFYQDVRNTEDINDIEKKLADLECQAASIIADLHRELPRGIFTLKRGPLDLLRKFLFVMHYRKTSCSSVHFQVDHPENARARQWIECFMQARGIRTALEAWLHFLRYYLGTSHSDIMRDGMALVKKYGLAGLQEMLTNSHIPPDAENYPAFTYLCQAGNYFLSIWEAAEGEEFILTHNAFGLWEGSACGCPGIHRIFVISPRVALVLRSGLLRPEVMGSINQSLFHSSLLDVNPVPATPIYVSEVGSSSVDSMESALAFCRSKSSSEAANDSFVFQITKLSRHQTLELNSVILANMKATGSLTFLSREGMLRTARAFRSSPINLPESNLLVPLIEHLTITGGPETLQPPLQSQTNVPDEDIDALSFVDVALYVLLMQIYTGRKQFASAYDRAYVVLKFIEKRSTPFADGINGEVEKAFHTCKGELHSEEVRSLPEGVRVTPLLSSIPEELSSQLFFFMMPYMSGLGAAMSGGKGILETLQDEVAVVSFLQCASRSPGVWHMLSCSNPEAPNILSKLFKEDTLADRIAASSVELLFDHDSPDTSSSWYDRAYALRDAFGMLGPTTNPVSLDYYRISAHLIQRLDDVMLVTPNSKRPKARLVHTMPKGQSDFLMVFITEMLRLMGYNHPSEDTRGEDCSKRIGEMVIVNILAWWGKHRRSSLDFSLNEFPPEMNFKLFEDEDAVVDN